MTPNGLKNKKIKIIFAVVLTALIIALVALAFFLMGNLSNKKAAAKVNNGTEQIEAVAVQKLCGDEMRGVWIASVNNINYPSKTGLSKAQLQNEIEAIVLNSYDLGINSIFFQVRPTLDALYPSKLFPASKFVSGTQGETVEDFDSLAYMIETADKYGIKVHAWINPFRVTMHESDEAQLSEDNFAVVNPEYAVKYADGKTYLDPGIPEVREYVVEGAKELANNYSNLSGIHFDDYFYPYPVNNEEFGDLDSYEKYGEGKDVAEWRRDNVNTLVKDTYEAIKEINPNLSFGVSVFGIWANAKSANTYVAGSNTNGLEAYNELYCDALSWAKGGYVDYIAPQNYWSFGTSAAPFDEVARWWNANLDGTGVDLYMGHATYKANDYSEREIIKQVEFSRSLACYKGSIFYGYSNISENDANLYYDIKELYSTPRAKDTEQSENTSVKINFPDNNSSVNTSYTYILGSCDPQYTLYVNGNAVSKTTGGYFSLYTQLEKGRNVFTFTQNGNKYDYVLNNGIDVYTGETKSNSLDKMEITNVYPSKSVWLDNNETLYVSCVAPAGSTVTASLADVTSQLKPTVYPEGDDKYLYEKYTGTLNITELVSATDIKLLGNVEFTAVLENETASKTGGTISQKGKDSYVYAEVKEDYTHTKVGTTSSFYDDFLPSSKGMRDYVTDVKDGYCKLRFGGYIAEENLIFTYGKPLMLNTILTTAIEVNAKDTTNNKNNSTDIRFGVTENIPVDVDFNGENGDMRIIIYNTDTSIIPQFEVPDNPLIKSIVGKKGTRENMLMYHVTLKDNENFYGFNIVYENGAMIVKLNNPQSLKEGNLPLAGKKIVVDAGHGGNDIGAPGPGNKPEKILNQEIAQSLAQKLRLLGAEVVESRPDDETVDLYRRMDILNDECPDLAISVHHNSIAGSTNALKTRGFMALYSNNSGVSLSKTISDVVCRELVRDQKATSYQQLAVARNHRFPSTLLEMCFISNVEEYQWSILEGNAEKSAQAIADGVIEYYKNQEKYLDY